MTAELNVPCTVCGRLDTNIREHGKRSYCAKHLSEFVTDVPSAWQASIFAFGTLILLIVATGITSALVPSEQPVSIVLSLIVVILPSIVWIFTLYRSSRKHGTEITPLVPIVMVMGALIAAAAVRPLLYELLAIPQWLSATTQNNRLLGNILVNGSINAFVLYSVVRFTIWRTPAFSHRVDGVLFAAASAWGYASMMTALYVIDQGSITLLNGTLRAISMLCAYVAPAYLIGFFLGRNRFEDMPFYYMTSGLAVSAGINGLLLFAIVELNNVTLSVTDSAYSPWPGVILATVILIVTYGTVLGLLRRHNTLTRARLERHE